MPVPDDLGYTNVGNRYDLSIAGWTKFWNETLKPERPLTPDFVKALIATETSFLVLPDTSSKIGPARGPIQITEATRKILRNPKGELSDHLIELTVEESREADPNIAAGIRWLYHKRYLLEHRIKREASWEETAAKYKGTFRQIGKDKTTDRVLRDLKKFHERLQNKRKEMRRIFILAAVLSGDFANAGDGAIETISSPRRNPSTGVIIHKQTMHFVELEVPVNRVWIGCSNTDPKEEVSLLGIHVEDQDIWYLFYPRRAIHDVLACLAEEKIYRNMMKSVKTVRVVGEFSGVGQNPKTIYPNDRTPRRFRDKPNEAGGFFIRFQAGDKCKAYFANGCDLPKNYWAGATPLE